MNSVCPSISTLGAEQDDAAKTLATIADDPKHLGAQLGVTAVLHT
ncbi:hypothetical protein [Bradyrhizobium sp. SRL28]|nr:hypothetical protein [Bradyrhizobium sp. SRL28]